MDIFNLTNLLKEFLRTYSESKRDYALYTVETAGYVYIGKAAIGADPGQPVWQIKRITTASPYITTWAEGDNTFTHIMSDYGTITFK